MNYIVFFYFTKYEILINIMHVIERIPGQSKEQVKQFLSEKLKINSRETYSVQGIYNQGGEWANSATKLPS